MHGEFCIAYFGIGFFACYIMEVLVSVVTLIVQRAFYYRRLRKYDSSISCTNHEWDEFKKILQNKAEDDKL